MTDQDKPNKLSADDFEVWQAALAEHQRLMMLARQSVVALEVVFAKRYGLTEADRIDAAGNIQRGAAKVEGDT